MKSDFLVALTQLAAERNLPREAVLSAIEAGLVSAYRKDMMATGQNVSVKLDPGSGEISVYLVKTVVEKVEDASMEISLEEATAIQAGASINDSVATERLPNMAGRIAAQTAKQVVMQRLREAEREIIFTEYSEREGELFSVSIHRVEPKQVVVDLGKAEAILPMSEQVFTDRYRVGLKLRVILSAVNTLSTGPDLVVSRVDTRLIKRLFEIEVPEIANGAVEIVAISREPGFRTKIAVRAIQDRVDPVGSCVGLRGVRIQSIVNELQGEKIDVIEWSKDPVTLITNALNPAQVVNVFMNEELKTAVVTVPDRQLSLAIGKEGQNVRLAAKLTSWNLDIRSELDVDPEQGSPIIISTDALLSDIGLSTRTLNILLSADLKNLSEISLMSQSALTEIKGFGLKSYEELLTCIDEYNKSKVAATKPEIKAESVDKVLAAEKAKSSKAEAIEDSEDVKVKDKETSEEVTGDQEVIEESQNEIEEKQSSSVEIEQQVASEPVLEKPDTSKEEVSSINLQDLDSQESGRTPVEEGDDSLSSIRDLPEDVWSVKAARGSNDTGKIRFAEDIEGLKGGLMARRGAKIDNKKDKGKRKSKSGKRR
jgi:N utilization substance protein A